MIPKRYVQQINLAVKKLKMRNICKEMFLRKSYSLDSYIQFFHLFIHLQLTSLIFRLLSATNKWRGIEINYPIKYENCIVKLSTFVKMVAYCEWNAECLGNCRMRNNNNISQYESQVIEVVQGFFLL